MTPRTHSPRAIAVVLLLASLLTLPAAFAAGPQADPVAETVASLQRDALASSRAWEVLESLTVEVGHRFAGSSGDRAAVAWAERTLRELGFENVHTEPVTVPHWVRGEASGETLSPFPQTMKLIALGGSVGTPEEGISADVVEVDSLAALEALSEEQVRGKIVFVNQRMERTRDGSGYGTTVAIRGRSPVLAAGKGALAVLIRSVGTGPERFPHTGGTHYDDETPKIPAAALAIPDADVLAAQLRHGEPVRFRLRLTSRTLPDAVSANVIGEIRGRETPEEIVLLGAHLDSWDVGTGAVDDGAGCAIVTAAARLIGDLPRPPRRTVRVVFFANEEFGLSGARAYAEAHADELSRHVLAIESDLGAGPLWRFGTRWAPAARPLAERIASWLEPLGVEQFDDQAHGGADLIPLAAAHVPLADLPQDAGSYFDVHHTADDTLNQVDPQDLAKNVAAYATLAYAAAESLERLGPAPEVDQTETR